jgi:hypothetical protein
VDWNISFVSSVEKYPSAFCPPNVSCRSVRKWTSFGRMSEEEPSPEESPRAQHAQRNNGSMREAIRVYPVSEVSIALISQENNVH